MPQSGRSSTSAAEAYAKLRLCMLIWEIDIGCGAVLTTGVSLVMVSGRIPERYLRVRAGASTAVALLCIFSVVPCRYPEEAPS